LSGHLGELTDEQRAALRLENAANSSGRLLDPLIDRSRSGSEPWVRLGALDVAARPGGAAFISGTALQRAAQDGDGFVREAAQRLLRQSAPGLSPR
jgi:hypothetical protein